MICNARSIGIGRLAAFERPTANLEASIQVTLLPRVLKDAIKTTPAYGHYVLRRQRREYEDWLREGKSHSPPHFLKQMVVRQYAASHSLDVLVETGTYQGAMVFAVREDFRRIYSIELGAKLFAAAKRRFARYEHITILHGDSAKVLPGVLSQLAEPCLFWLDAHYSAGSTAMGSNATPILDEVKQILEHPISGHVIVIDDARHFRGDNDYPSIDELSELVARIRPGFDAIEVADDIIRIHESTASEIT